MEVFFYVLIAIEDGKLIKKGYEMVSDKAYYSEATCVEEARLIAQALFVKDGAKYDFRCVRPDYEPSNLESK